MRLGDRQDSMAKKGKKKPQQDVKAAAVAESTVTESDQAADAMYSSTERPASQDVEVEAEAAIPAEDPAAGTPDEEPADVSTSPLPNSDAAGEAVAGSEGDELSQLRLENESLRNALADKDAEIAAYQTRLAALPGVGSSTGDLEVLQSRLGELKQQQQQADENREKAWGELKRVIGEVAQLAESGKAVAAA